MSVEIPDKRYFKIGEVSKLASVAPHVLRYWESEFKEIQPKRTNSNQRLYRHEDVTIVLLIKKLLHEQGYTISGAKNFLATYKHKQEDTSRSTKARRYLETIKKELLTIIRLLDKKK